MRDESMYESLMRHDVPRTSRRNATWPLNTKPPRTDCCGKEPPACTCPKEKP